MANEASNATAGGIGLPTGAKIGKYEVRERLGIGGQAIVYKCYDSLLDRYVAVKQISSHLATEPKFLEMFRREAQILAKLGAKQKAIVNIHELVEDERGLFIIMEFVPGQTLEKTIEDANGPMEVKAGLQIIWRLAGALYDVHNAGIVHRDIKPANIIIAEGMQPKITDFGVAANMSGQTSLLMGTTKYMAPELFAGSEIDGRADMYSLGMIAYEMFIGRPKFNDIFADVVRDKHTEALRWMKWHGNDQVKAPPVHEVNTDVPKTLSYIVAKMMAKNKDERFKNMEDLGKAIKAGFSTRGRGAEGAMGLAVPTGLTEVGIGSARLPGRQLDAAGDIVPSPSAGGELPLPGEGPPTAALPKKKLSKKAKIALVAVIGVALIAIMIAKIVQSKNDITRLMEQAEIDYAKAEKIYNEAYDEVQSKGPSDVTYNKAFEEFQKVYNTYKPRGNDIGEWKKAWAMMTLTKARIEAVNGKWAEAQAMETNADKDLKAVQASTSDGKLIDWTSKRLADLKNFQNERNNARKFIEGMGSASEKIDAKDFDGARKIFDGLAQINLTPYQKKQFEEARKALNTAEAIAKYLDLRKKADDAWAGNSPDSTKLYRECLTYLESDSGRLMSSSDVSKYKNEITEIIDKIVKQGSEDALIKQIQKYKDNKDLDRELNAILDYLRQYPKGSRATEYAKRVTDLRVDIARRELRKAQNSADKRLRANEILKYISDDPEAMGVIALLDKQDKFDAVLADGHKAKNNQKWDEAIDLFSKALEMKPADTEIPKLITECKWQKQLAVIEGLKKDNRYDELIKAIDDLGAIDPTRQAEATNMKKAVQNRKTYLDSMADAKKSLEGGKFQQAYDYVKNAEMADLAKEHATEIESIRHQIKYKEIEPKAMHFITVEDYDMAIIFLKQMQREINTEDVQKLLKMCEQKKKEKNKTPEEGK